MTRLTKKQIISLILYLIVAVYISQHTLVGLFILGLLFVILFPTTPAPVVLDEISPEERFEQVF